MHLLLLLYVVCLLVKYFHRWKKILSSKSKKKLFWRQICCFVFFLFHQVQDQSVMFYWKAPLPEKLKSSIFWEWHMNCLYQVLFNCEALLTVWWWISCHHIWMLVCSDGFCASTKNEISWNHGFQRMNGLQCINYFLIENIGYWSYLLVYVWNKKETIYLMLHIRLKLHKRCC